MTPQEGSADWEGGEWATREKAEEPGNSRSSRRDELQGGVGGKKQSGCSRSCG